jgi:5,10-methylene-tetrahydrofolate dehydrogenase/methenyl tetrahydrofolate cyclohydrolase
VVLGRSNIVGTPVALMLLHKYITSPILRARCTDCR